MAFLNSRISYAVKAKVNTISTRVFGKDNYVYGVLIKIVNGKCLQFCIGVIGGMQAVLRQCSWE